MMIMLLAKRMGRFFESGRHMCNRNVRHFGLRDIKVLISVRVSVCIVSIVTVSVMLGHNRDMLAVTMAVLMTIG